MCRLKSCIVLKNRVFCPSYDSHQKMLEELHIEDNEINAMKTFVRVELRPPKNTNLIIEEWFTSLSKPLSEWTLVVDQDILPDWWEPAIYRLAIEEEVQKWRDKYVLIEQQDRVIQGRGLIEQYHLYKCKNIALTNTCANLMNCKQISCDGGNHIVACNSEVISGAATDIQYDLYKGSTLISHNESPVWAYDDSTVFSYVGNIYLKDNATCFAQGDTSVFAFGKSMVKASQGTTVRACGDTTVELHNEAVGIIYTPSVKCDVVDSTATLIKKFDK